MEVQFLALDAGRVFGLRRDWLRAGDDCGHGVAGVGMSAADQFMLALTAWREDRHGGRSGMQSVINVVLNRAKRRNTTPYEECVRPWQFSSITAKDDPQLANWPSPTDPEWHEAQNLAAEGDDLNDITDGATSYYALSMAEPPAWAAAMTKTVDIEGQRFLR